MVVLRSSGDIVYNIDDFPYEKIGKYAFLFKRSKRNPCFYYERPATFDIETTSISGENPFGYMYIWQFALEGNVCIGRRWEEFQTFLGRIAKQLKLDPERKLVIYSHFLSFEFQFVRSFVEFKNIFAKEPRKIMKASTDKFEFRCSYFLSNMSLEKFCENSELCVHKKKSGEDFDYRVIRTPDTPLTEEELQYCVNDVLGLEECLMSLLQNDTICTIPLTNTGYVRRDCKKAMAKNRKNRSIFIQTRLSLHLYEFMQKVFRGGDTHASRFLSDVHLKNMDSWDLQSSYPAWIMTDYYPMTKFVRFTGDVNVSNYCKRFCCVMKISFYNIHVKELEPHTYIDIGHCERKRGVVDDNGRVKEAEYIEYYCTEIDLRIINECYDYEKWHMEEGYYARRGQLPEELKNVVMKYYTAKTTLKGLEEKFYEYMKSKNRLNSIFGMMVCALIHPELLFEHDEWIQSEGDREQKLADFYEKWSGFLPYQWGIYVTAHARERLREGIAACKKEDGYSRAVYWDTDSVKHLADPEIEAKFQETNKRRLKEIECAAIPPDVVANGKHYPMGIWEKEHHIEEFKTYGAKKYCTLIKCNPNKLTEEDKKRVWKDDLLFTITVAGMNKQKGAERMLEFARSQGNKNPLDCAFILGMQYSNVGRTISYYNDDSTVHEITIDGSTFTTGSNIGVVDTTYELGITGDYLDIIVSSMLEKTELLKGGEHIDAGNEKDNHS